MLLARRGLYSHTAAVEPENHERRVEQQPAYKHKTLTHILAFFQEEKERAEEIIFDAMDAERSDCSGSGGCRCSCHYVDDSDADSDCECDDAKLDDFEYTYDNWDEEEWAADEKIDRLEEVIEALSNALEQYD